MKEFKGTPGPWEVEDNGYFYDINAARGTVGNVCSSAIWFDNDEHRGPVAMANAQLIAAAPKMLQALQTIQQKMSSFITLANDIGINDDDGFYLYAAMEAERMARDVISEALGEIQ